jgi:hypothetical protein
MAIIFGEDIPGINRSTNPTRKFEPIASEDIILTLFIQRTGMISAPIGTTLALMRPSECLSAHGRRSPRFLLPLFNSEIVDLNFKLLKIPIQDGSHTLY